MIVIFGRYVDGSIRRREDSCASREAHIALLGLPEKPISIQDIYGLGFPEGVIAWHSTYVGYGWETQLDMFPAERDSNVSDNA